MPPVIDYHYGGQGPSPIVKPKNFLIEMKLLGFRTDKKRFSICVDHMEKLVSMMETEKPIERIRTLERRIREVDRISSIENSVRTLKEQFWTTKEVLTFSETMEFLGISRRTLSGLMARNHIPYYNPAGKLLFFKRKDLCKWATRNAATAADDSQPSKEEQS